MVEKISNEMQEQILKFQQSQQEARLLAAQKYQFEMQLKEAKNAISELEKLDKAEVHKAIGQILIKTDGKKVLKELKEKAETFEVRLKSLEKQEAELTKNMKSLQDRLQGVIQGTGG